MYLYRLSRLYRAALLPRTILYVHTVIKIMQCYAEILIPKVSCEPARSRMKLFLKKHSYFHPNLQKTWGLYNIIFVILICFHLTNFFEEEKFSALPSRNKVADEKTEHCNLMKKFVCLWKCKFSSGTLLLQGGRLNFSSPKKWKQVKITSMILQIP